MFWFLNFGKPAFLELLAMTGYKFVALCLIVVADLLVGSSASYLAVFALGALFAMFFYNSMMRHAQANTLSDHMKEVSMNKKTFMFGNAVV